jgi:hypothetical protein
MTVIWGLDLREMQWRKFKGSYMFNKVYHLRRTKMIVYQIAMILCVASESVGTAAISGMDLSLLDDVPITSSLLMLQPGYVNQKDAIEDRSGRRAHVHNDDFIGIASYNIFVGIAVATILGSGFFFDLFWPERYESPAVRLAWKICSVVVSFMALAAAVALTVWTPFFADVVQLLTAGLIGHCCYAKNIHHRCFRSRSTRTVPPKWITSSKV